MSQLQTSISTDRRRGGPKHHAAIQARSRMRPPLRPGKMLAHPIQRAISHPLATAPIGQQFNGSATDVMLQGFHWTSSHSQNPNWYQIIAQNAPAIRGAKFDLVWFPPPSQAAFNDEGYMPTRWNVLNSAYGTENDLKAAISALNDVRAIADVVINHRCGTFTDGVDFDFPSFPDQKAAVCIDDQRKIGTGNPDTGEDQPAALDLDHINSDVQSAIQAYLANLKSAGFSGWRYDEVRGYAGVFVGQYNDASKPYLSVGEFWDPDRQNVVNWIDSTRGKSMAFDFPTRANLKSAIDQRQFWLLKTIDGKPTGAIGFWPSMCVTFLEKHDTEKDRSPSDEFGNGDQVLQGYAYLLTHPGIPCVFWTHYFDYGPTIQSKIKSLISIRKRNHLTRTSVVNIIAADDGKYAAIIDDKVALKLGPAPWDPGEGWKLSLDGNDLAVWEKQSP